MNSLELDAARILALAAAIDQASELLRILGKGWDTTLFVLYPMSRLSVARLTAAT
ncbi:hypothetical protein [Laspinema olomoucense]|uniref:hypothetical protein n=1 Tax=Laspinema olomoucense TaxID=3231600 RepID=UPI0021BA98C6|nr:MULTISPECIES: hypothetical protein [unclassified Laspinema]MCT7989666.1 hypothetical protein [Laspinema sp. D3a]